jgi:hypothetical protein
MHVVTRACSRQGATAVRDSVELCARREAKSQRSGLAAGVRSTHTVKLLGRVDLCGRFATEFRELGDHVCERLSSVDLVRARPT